MKEDFLKHFRTHFISGLLVLAPLFLTVIVIGYLVRIADAFVVNPVFRLLPVSDVDSSLKTVLTKIAIGIVVVGLVTLIGLWAEKILFKQFMAAGEGMIKAIPVFNKVYGSIREIAQAFFGDKKGVFKRVVYVEYPRKGAYALGFITQDKPWDIHQRIGKPILTVFIPSPPNPATGLFIFVPVEDIIETDVTVEEGIKLVISGGAAVPPLKIK